MHFGLRCITLSNCVKRSWVHLFLVLPNILHGGLMLLAIRAIRTRESAGGVHRSYDYVFAIIIEQAVALELPREPSILPG